MYIFSIASAFSEDAWLIRNLHQPFIPFNGRIIFPCMDMLHFCESVCQSMGIWVISTMYHVLNPD